MHHSGYGCNTLRLQCFIKYKILSLQGILALHKAVTLRFFHGRLTVAERIIFIHVYIIFCKFDVVGCLKDSNCR